MRGDQHIVVVWLSASYDWLQTEFDGEPSGYIIDLVAFLRGIFTSFTNLPVSRFVFSSLVALYLFFYSK